MRDEQCVFCRIAAGEIPSVTVCEDESFRVILDLGPASRGHALILPKEHYRDLTELPDELCGRAFSLAGRLGAAMKESLGCSGFNLVQNNGAAAGQTVFHFHIHVIPRYEGGPDMVSWTPGQAEEKEQRELAERIAGALRRGAEHEI